jgi:GNAT superfamily N-acetyltransferase
VIIKPAVHNDLELLMRFRDDAARWLAAKGIDQWSAPWPTEDLVAKGMLRSIRAGESFIAWDGTTAAATITIDRRANPDLWTAQEAAEPALYAHKLTVARAYAGSDLGGELLDWASTRAADHGDTWLRVDVWTTNHQLQDYNRRQGFRHVRTVPLPHNPSGAVFQRPACRVPTPRLQDATTTARPR